MRPRGPGNEDGLQLALWARAILVPRALLTRGATRGSGHSRTQSPSYARCDEGLWPNPKPETIKTW